MTEFQIVVSGLPGLTDPSIAIAASRAGAIGVLDLEHNHDVAIALKHIEKVSKYTGNHFGIKLRGEADELFSAIRSRAPAHLKTIILAYTNHEKIKNAVKVLQTLQLSVLLECTSLEEVQAGEEARVDGIIAKGQEAGGRVGNETTFILLQRILKSLSIPIYAHGGIGLHTAAACYAAGAAGVVLDSQIALARARAEEPLLLDDDGVIRVA